MNFPKNKLIPCTLKIVKIDEAKIHFPKSNKSLKIFKLKSSLNLYSQLMKNNFAKKLIEWYKINQRDLPWRKTNDPYKIWVSEIILQQTRIDQGTPYYLKFTDKFPHVKKLADSTLDELMKVCQGIGY